MGARSLLFGVLLLSWGFVAPGARGESTRSEGELPAVARPRFALGDRELGAGTAFFLPVPHGAGAVGVAAAHSFDFADLARTDQVAFRLGASGRRVSVSAGFYAQPGRSLSGPGANLRDDYVVFALEFAPYGVRVLEPEREGQIAVRERVRILGVPAAVAQDEDVLFGTVAELGDTRIVVDLDVASDLRGWGGAPVLSNRTGRVVGILEAAWPEGERHRLGVAPIEGVLQALERPLEAGRGTPFGHFASHDPRSAPLQGATRSRAAAPRAPQSSEPFQTTLSRALPRPAEGESLLGEAGAVRTELRVQIEYPPEDAIVGDAMGAFVSGRALALLGEFRRFDVVFVLDTSGSANQMTGADINNNGIIGQGGLRGVFGKTDAGDSILAAEVAAAKQILRGLDPRSTRVALVTFAGSPPRGGGLVIGSGRARKAAITEEPLTTDYDRIERTLSKLLERGAQGMTHMAAGVDQATIELLGLRGGLSEPDPESEHVVLFFTDGQPTLPYDAIFEADNVKAVLRAAERAARAGIRIHSFAIGPEALEGPVATVEMASRTDGYFTPVRHPGDLVEVIENVSFANIDELRVRNLTTDADAVDFVVNADGSWSAMVPLTTGRNRIEVRARSNDGTEARSEITLQYAPGVPSPTLPRELTAQRNRMLEQRLLELKRDRAQVERGQVEQTRRELMIEIEEERSQAQERAARQRRELDLDVQPSDPGPSAVD